MHERLTRRGLVAVGAAAGAALLAPAPPAPAEPLRRRGGPELVILIDWDGFGANLLDRAEMPNLRGLVARGSLTTARSTYNTYSNSARASMSTGAHPEVHDNAGYYLDRASGVVVAQNRDLRAQTITESLAAAGRTTASVGWYMVQDHGSRLGDPDQLYVQPAAPFASRVDAALAILAGRPVISGASLVTVTRRPDFLALYSGELDALQHEQGPGGPDVPALLQAHDVQLGRLLRGLAQLGIADRTAVLVTADHGLSPWTTSIMPALVEAIRQRGLRPEVVEVGRTPAADTDVVLLSNGVRMSNVYLRGFAASEHGRRMIRQAADRVGHIPNVFDSYDLHKLRAADKLGDLVLETTPPFHFSLLDDGRVRGSHGSTFEQEVPLVMAGRGIRRSPHGASRASLVDVAPTIALLLGAPAPADSQGRPLRTLLEPVRSRRPG